MVLKQDYDASLSKAHNSYGISLCPPQNSNDTAMQLNELTVGSHVCSDACFLVPD